MIREVRTLALTCVGALNHGHCRAGAHLNDPTRQGRRPNIADDEGDDGASSYDDEDLGEDSACVGWVSKVASVAYATAILRQDRKHSREAAHKHDKLRTMLSAEGSGAPVTHGARRALPMFSS